MTNDFASMSLRDFCAALASKSPAPGGGAAAAVMSAQAAALLAMVVEYSRGKKDFAALEPQGDEIIKSLRTAIDASLIAATRDADAYAALNALWRRAKDDPERVAHWDKAVHDAIAAPNLVIELAEEIAARSAQLAGKTAKHLDSDLAIAADLAACAARAAAWNVRVNLPSMTDEVERTRLANALEARLMALRDDVTSAESTLKNRAAHG
jgi:formiminotetrahydrofolate cyclodeaminase